MTARWVLIVALLCALPAQGAGPTLPDAVVSVLTPVDSVPSRTALDTAFLPDVARERLPTLAGDPTVDLGIQIRAIRALPTYCPVLPGTCGPGTLSHDTLVELVERYRDATQAVQAPADVLRLRAAVEALGATRSGLPEDVGVLLTLLGDGVKQVAGHPSLDVRAAAARAIGQLCDRGAMDALFPHLLDPAPQVVAQVARALQDLELCTKQVGQLTTR